MKKNIPPILILIFFLSGIFSTGCITDTSAEDLAFQKAVDTLFARELKTYTLELDSICELRMDSMILSNIDSITTLRLKEIERLTKNSKQ